MRKLRTILVDDERVGRERLRRMLKVHPDIEVVAECNSGQSAVNAVQENAPDLLFLDINMPGMDGFGVLDALGPERHLEVIFVTAYDEHAVRAFDACALDYLLKPASPERLGKALDRARQRIASAASTPDASTKQEVANQVITRSHAHRFTVRSGGRVSFVAPDEIDWIEAAGNYAILHVGKANHMIRETMSGLEAQLASEKFLRVNRSAIVNLRRVKELFASPSGENFAILHTGQQVPVTRSLREVADQISAL